jgi:hypothetical protein
MHIYNLQSKKKKKKDFDTAVPVAQTNPCQIQSFLDFKRRRGAKNKLIFRQPRAIDT